MNTTLHALWREVLEDARHCPSPHNVQPWALDVLSDGSARLYIVGERTFPFTDETGSFIVSALAMFLEYLKIAAQNRGYRLMSEVVDVEALDLQAPRSLFAVLSLRYEALSPHRFSNTELVYRRTSRKPNLRRPVAQSDLETLRSVVSRHGYGFHAVRDSREIEWILNKDITALFHDVNDPKYFGELRPLLKVGPKSETFEGLHYKAMEMPKVQLYMLKHFPWMVKIPVVRDVVRTVYHRQLGHCAVLAFVTGDFWKRSDAARAGKMLITFWLELSRMGMYLHPFGNLVTNKEARGTVEERAGVDKVWFVCRIGYTDEPDASNRYTVDKIANFIE
jgi:hypothetical protein